ncbi:hypothetical protein [Nostoc sp. DSM 114161]|uniref:hypothetical protein n=1 Tax=Nostoc sp. DSM 114161 TaxID=3440143 RepID=UPI0040466C9C
MKYEFERSLWNVQGVYQLISVRMVKNLVNTHYICANRGRQFIDSYEQQGYPEAIILYKSDRPSSLID